MKVTVTASKSYDVLIEKGMFGRSGELIRKALPRAEKIAVISDDVVWALYGRRLEELLRAAGLEPLSFVLEHGEQSKNGESFLRILEFLAESRLTRSDAVAALGGGMVGDIAGFASACFLRGLSFVQIPTTLLAMVDSSVGGKTAIDLKAGKNLAGAFCQPELVICDPGLLDSLPADIFADGCAEVIKYGVMEDAGIFGRLEAEGPGFDREEVIARCVEIKRDFVCRDEFDNGERRKLNLGHTLGHAAEIKSGFALSHGKAVAIGLAAVCRAAGMDGAERTARLLERFGLPTACPFGVDELMPAMLSDKKRRGGSVAVIVPERIGSCGIVNMSPAELRAFFGKGI